MAVWRDDFAIRCWPSMVIVSSMGAALSSRNLAARVSRSLEPGA
jgi:hypothetical protein